jgi:hypothetical protein
MDWAGERCVTCHGEGYAVTWGNPITRLWLQRVITWPTFAALRIGHSGIAALGAVLDRRNRRTGQLNPSRETLGEDMGGYSVRAVSTGTGRLAGLGLIGKFQPRGWGWTGSNDYWLTPRFFELAAVAYTVGAACKIRRHSPAKSAGTRLQNLPTNGDPPDPGIWGSPLDQGGSGHPGFDEPSREEEGDRAALATWATFEALFRSARLAKYGQLPGSELAEAKRVEAGRYLQGLTSRGVELASLRGVPMERGAICAAISAELLKRWFAHEGSQKPEEDRPFLVREKHPLWALYGRDLIRFGDEALERWARKIKPPKEPVRPPPSAEERAHHRAAARGLAGDMAPRPAFPSWEITAEDPTAEDLAMLVAARAAMQERAALAAQVEVAKAQIAEAVPEVVRDFAYDEAAPSPERREDAAASSPNDEPARTPPPAEASTSEPTEEAPRNDREPTEPRPGPEAMPEAAEGSRLPRLRRPGSRPFSGTTSAPGVRPDAWRYVARPDIRPAADTDDTPPDE